MVPMANPHSSISAETAYWIDIVFILLYCFFFSCLVRTTYVAFSCVRLNDFISSFCLYASGLFCYNTLNDSSCHLKQCRLFERLKSFLLIIFSAICILAVPSELMVSKIYLLHTDKQQCDLRHHQHVDKCERTLRTCTTLFFSSFPSLSLSFVRSL